MFGYDHEEHLKEQFLADQPLLGGRDAFEDFCKEIDIIKEDSYLDIDEMGVASIKQYKADKES